MKIQFCSVWDKSIKNKSFRGKHPPIIAANKKAADFSTALIKQYDRSDALFYCDPPYHTTEKHYAEQFSEDDHYRLNGVLRR